MVHTAIALAGIVSLLAVVGRQHHLPEVGNPPDMTTPTAVGGSTESYCPTIVDAGGSFAKRDPGSPVRHYCDGADELDDAERLAIDPVKPTAMAGRSAHAVGWLPMEGKSPLASASSDICAVYERHRLGQQPSGDAEALYLDMVRRCVAGCVYQDPARIAYNASNDLLECGGFSLAHREVGADEPSAALTWIGLRRLEALQRCVQTALQEDVPGDVLECGVLFGGAAAAAKAVLRATGADSGPGARRVLCADTFVPRDPAIRVPAEDKGAAAVAVEWAGVRVARALARSLPDAALAALTTLIDRLMPDGARSFPALPEGEEVDSTVVKWVRCVLRAAGHGQVPMPGRIGPGLHHVRSHLARMGLLDDNVVFLRGFFSASLGLDDWPAGTGRLDGAGGPLPKGHHPVLRRLAVLRLDGDLYVSTRTALEGAYHRLSCGGFCIIDDYNSFPGCKRAVDEFRAAKGITAPMVCIDAHAIQWRKGDSEEVRVPELEDER